MKNEHPEYRDSSPKGVAARFGVSTPTIYKAMNDGLLKAKKAGKRTIITPEAEQDYKNNMPDYKG